MKLPGLAIGLCAAMALSVPASAQKQSSPLPQEAVPAPNADTQQQQQQQQAQAQAAVLQQAIGGAHVAVLRNAEGGIAAVQNEQGQNALVAFLEPEAAKVAQQSSENGELAVAPMPLMQVLSTWDGPIIFEGSAESIGQAQSLQPEAEPFSAPVYVVLADGQETQINTEAGAVTPILLNFDDASDMKSRVEQSVDAEMTVEVVPVEFGAVLMELVNMQQDEGYRIFTHPDTVALVQAVQAAPPPGTPQ